MALGGLLLVLELLTFYPKPVGRRWRMGVRALGAGLVLLVLGGLVVRVLG